jgi:hypothetical protein
MRVHRDYRYNTFTLYRVEIMRVHRDYRYNTLHYTGWGLPEYTGITDITLYCTGWGLPEYPGIIDVTLYIIQGGDYNTFTLYTVGITRVHRDYRYNTLHCTG